MRPVVTTTTLVTQDGVPVDTVHLPAPRDDAAGGVSDPGLVIVIAHGFTQSWQNHMVWPIAKRFNACAGVVTFDFRGHGRSGGMSTLGDKEIYDLDVAVRFARELGYDRVATVGFSMGGSVVLRQAGLLGGTDAVVSVSSPGHWYFRGTKPMRRVHFAAERRLGRAFARQFLKTRIAPTGWNPMPLPPADAAGRISRSRCSSCTGTADPYFPLDHGRELYDGARRPRRSGMLPGFGHAERAMNDALSDRIAAWVTKAVASHGAAAEQEQIA